MQTHVSRREVLRNLAGIAALPLLGVSAAAGASAAAVAPPELATGFLPDGRRLYQLNRVGADGLIHWVSGVVSANPADRFRLRLARCVDEVSGEVVPEHPVTHSVFGRGMSWEACLDHLKRCRATGIGLIAPDQVLVQPEAKVPVYYSELDAFTRYFECPQCLHRMAVAEVRDKYADQFRYVDFEPHLTCPACRYAGGFVQTYYQFGAGGRVHEVRSDDRVPDASGFMIPFRVVPATSGEVARIVVRWDPDELEPLEDMFDDRVHYLWRIPEDYRQRVRAGDLATLVDVLPGVTTAIRCGRDFLFRGDTITHVA